MGGLVQRDDRRRGHVLAADRRADVLGFEGRAGAAARPPAEHLAQDVLEALTAARRAAAARAAQALRAPGETLEISLAPAERCAARAAAETLEALKARLALGVDLAAVERLALGIVTDD